MVTALPIHQVELLVDILCQGHMNICVIRLVSQMFMLKIPSSVRCVKDFVTLALWLLRIDYVSLAMYAVWFLW